MPSRMIHYVVAEQVKKEVSIRDLNRFKIGSLCPDMSVRQDDSKLRTHYFDCVGDKKGMNWNRFAYTHKERIFRDDLYLGVLCHLITDAVWFHDIMNVHIRSTSKTKEERHEKYLRGYEDFHRLNYILKEEFGLEYELQEDRNIELEDLHPELYDEVIGALYQDFYEEAPAAKEELAIYRYDLAEACIKRCVEECVDAIRAFRAGEEMKSAKRYYVPVLD